MSPLLTFLLPPLKAELLNRTPPEPAVLPTVAPLAVAVTNMFPVIVAVPMMAKAVVTAALTPAEDAVHVTVGRVATVALVISTAGAGTA